jgi:serine/threonine protein kinase
MVYPLMPHALNTDGGRKQALERDNGLKATMTDACTALVHMHDKNICHRDITLDNLFVDSKNRVVVGDFGSARHLLSTDTVPIKTKEYMQTWLSLQLPPTANVGQKRTFSAFDQPEVNGRQCDVMMLGMTLTMLIAGVTFNHETFYSDGMGTLFEPLIKSINQSASGPNSEFKLQPNHELMANAYHSDLVNDRISAMVKRHGRSATVAALHALKAMVTGTVSAPEALAMAQAI